jgi:hypothetical protein
MGDWGIMPLRAIDPPTPDLLPQFPSFLPPKTIQQEKAE